MKESDSGNIYSESDCYNGSSRHFAFLRSQLFEQDGTLYATFGELKEAIKEKNMDSVKTVSQRFEEQLETRNRMCKFVKRGH